MLLFLIPSFNVSIFSQVEWCLFNRKVQNKRKYFNVRLLSWNNIITLFLGGTSVSGALECPSDESRMIVSLDTTQMVGVNNFIAYVVL